MAHPLILPVRKPLPCFSVPQKMAYWTQDVEPATYLSDSTGRQVTPLVRTSGPPDPLPLNAGRGPTKAYHKAHGNITPGQKARAVAASLQAHIRAGTFIPQSAQSTSENSDSEDSSE